MTFKTFTAIALALAYSASAFANGGNDPIDGIDIIVKEVSSQAPVMTGSFDPDQLKQLNSLTGMDRPAYIAKVTGAMAQESIRGAAPKGGWNGVFQKALTEDWNPEEKGGSTIMRTQAGGQGYEVSFATVCCSGWGYERPEPTPVPPGIRDPNYTGGILLALLATEESATTGCVTFAGAPDQNCDGVDDAQRAIVEADPEPVYVIQEAAESVPVSELIAQPIAGLASQSNSISTPLLLGGIATVVGLGVLIADDDDPNSP